MSYWSMPAVMAAATMKPSRRCRGSPKISIPRFDDFAPVSTIGRVHCPVLLVHGSQDEIVPFRDAARLLAAGRPGGVEAIEVCGGHDLTLAIEAHATLLLAFLGRCCRIDPKPVRVSQTHQANASLPKTQDSPVPFQQDAQAIRPPASAYSRGELACNV
jgi:hypothetical protein